MFDFSATTTITIDAPPHRVWNVLTDTQRWAEWCTVIHYLDGALAVGEKPKFNLTPPKGRSYSFSPTIEIVGDARELQWVGRTGLPGIFDGRHRFTLQPTDTNSTTLTNSETFSGLLAPLFRRFLVDINDVRDGFEALNAEIKARAEE